MKTCCTIGNRHVFVRKTWKQLVSKEIIKPSLENACVKKTVLAENHPAHIQKLLDIAIHKRHVLLYQTNALDFHKLVIVSSIFGCIIFLWHIS